MIKKTQLILVGGFLGAGKTTLLFEATKQLMNDGLRVGLVTNDQASELVDTAFLLQTRTEVAEVSGSCFCCNFNAFIDSVKKVGLEAQADIIIAEPVGSCTDLSATLLQPLKAQFNKELIVSPLTVLADPLRLAEILEGRTAGLHPSAAYIYKKQLEESDIILISKTDLLEPEKLEFLLEKVKVHYPYSKVLSASSKLGEGVDEWLKIVLSSVQTGQRIVEIDYDIYAEGEAVLGWLNASINLSGDQVNWDAFAGNFLNELSRVTDAMKVSVGHIKIIVENGNQYLTGNITGTGDTLSIRGNAGVSDTARMIINARVGVIPLELEKMVKETLENIAKDNVNVKIDAWKCLSPGYPNPTYRFDKVIENK